LVPPPFIDCSIVWPKHDTARGFASRKRRKT
jgi:hypothetical protein